MLIALLLTAFAIGGVAAGSQLGEQRGLPPRVAAVGAGLLFGIAVFSMLPEVAQSFGWMLAVAAMLVGAALLWSVDRFLHPICPGCSHTHNHTDCSEPPLHGFGLPMLLATALHSFIDGWSVQFLSLRSASGLAVPVALGLHKIPEGFALGLITREAIRSRRVALAACFAAESLTLVGALVEPGFEQAARFRFGLAWAPAIMALTGGAFLFLAAHAIHAARKRPGVTSTFLLTVGALAAIAFFRSRFPGF